MADSCALADVGKAETVRVIDAELPRATAGRKGELRSPPSVLFLRTSGAGREIHVGPKFSLTCGIACAAANKPMPHVRLNLGVLACKHPGMKSVKFSPGANELTPFFSKRDPQKKRKR